MSETKTCFKKVDYDLSGLHHYIEIGDIGLPDIQQPFVWSNTKVRDLFDSMYRGMALRIRSRHTAAIRRVAAFREEVPSQLRRYLLKKSRVRCQASLAAASS
jgi:hypothetical protein